MEAADRQASGPSDGSTEENARKRVRSSSTAHNAVEPILPVVGYHIALVGPPHLTKPLATALLKAKSNNGTCRWRTNSDDADIVAVQALKRSLQDRKGTPNHYASPLHKRHVHIMETLSDSWKKNPSCHIVLVTQCSPQAIARLSSRQTLRQLPAVQAIWASSALQTEPALCIYTRVSVLVCIVEGSVDVVSEPIVADSALPSSLATEVFTCWHPELEENRQTIAQRLWKRCSMGMREGPNDTIVSPMIAPHLMPR